MIEVQILIPVNDNNGQTFSANRHDAFVVFATILFGGITRLPGTASGHWIQNGAIYIDETLIFVVAPNSICQGDRVGNMADFAKQHYQQLAIYIRYLGLSEVL